MVAAVAIVALVVVAVLFGDVARPAAVVVPIHCHVVVGEVFAGPSVPSDIECKDPL